MKPTAIATLDGKGHMAVRVSVDGETKVILKRGEALRFATEILIAAQVAYDFGKQPAS